MPEPAEVYAEALRGRLPELRRRYGVSGVSLFGSYVRGDQRTSSDLDILVDFARRPDLLELIHLQNELSDTLGIKVDLVMRSALRGSIGDVITHEAVAI